MKVEELVSKASEELKSEKEEKILEVIKHSLKNVEDAKKTLKKIVAGHKKLLDSEIEDLELDDLEY